MGIPVLVVDSNVDYAKLIKKSLETNHLFQVTLATRAIEALMRFTETKYQVTIIDFSLPDLNGIDLIRQIRGIDENIVIVAVLENGESHSREIAHLGINVVLDKPAYLSDLPLKLAQVLNLPIPKPSPQKPPTDPAIDQSQHDDQAQEVTIREGVVQNRTPMEEISKQEIHHGETSKDKIAELEPHFQEASQSEGDQSSQEKIEAIVDEYTHQEPSVFSTPHPQISQGGPSQSEEMLEEPILIPPWLKEPARVEQQLASLEKEHTAYAILLSIGNTPWTYSENITENQAYGIVRLLSEHDEGLQSKGALIRYIRLSGTGNDYLLYATPVVGDINLSMIFSMDTPFSVARRQTHKLSRLLVEQDPRKQPRVAKKPTIEKSIPMDLVDDEPLPPSDWIPGSSPSTRPKERSIPPAASTVKEEPSIVPAASTVEEEPSAVPAASTVQEEPSVVPTASTVEAEPQAEKVMPSALAATPQDPPLPDDWLPKEPRPSSHLPFLDQEPTQPKETGQLEPINLTQQEPKYYLPFTAILLPRFPHHRLTGSLANKLENWLKDLCVAWGWRVDHVDLRSEFLRFTISLSPDVAPAQAVQHLANNLSSRILDAFPGLTDDLPSGQFWTKSYLLTAGSDVGKERLALFIETTRKDQGLVN
jgi:CheY-like chemotaxis protein